MTITSVLLMLVCGLAHQSCMELPLIAKLYGGVRLNTCVYVQYVPELFGDSLSFQGVNIEAVVFGREDQESNHSVSFGRIISLLICHLYD